MTSQAQRQVEYLPLDSLAPDPRNPKTHDQSVISSSVDRFGVLDLIVRDGRTGYIVSGHGRHKALSEMRTAGHEPPNGVHVGDSGEWLVPVVTGWSSKDDDEAGAALIALNRTTELGGWDDQQLLDLLEGLGEADQGLLGVGFTNDDITDLHNLLDSLAEVDRWTSGTPDQEAEPLAGESGDDDLIARAPVSDGQFSITVTIEAEHYGDFYQVISDLPYVVEVRDKDGKRPQ